MTNRYWLLLEKSDSTRVSKGIDSYLDETGETYRYDSLVPNHKQLDRGDFIVIRKENDILGIGTIFGITQNSNVKIHRRCPSCTVTDIRERRTKIPRWKCGRCAHEFEEPDETIADVQSYVASIDAFARLNSPPSVKEVKRCAVNENGEVSQLSILELDPIKIQSLLEGVTPYQSSRVSSSEKSGQGFGLSSSERKLVELRAMRVVINMYEMRG